jgi:hypothetical protein
MSSSAPQSHVLRRGFWLGTLVVFAIVALASLALGADLWIAVLVGFFVGLFVGGGLGLLISARLDASD